MSRTLVSTVCVPAPKHCEPRLSVRGLGCAVLRLIAILLGTLIPAGLGAIFVWSTMNLMFRGDASPARVILGALVLVGVFALLYGTYRYVNSLEEMP